MTNIKALNQQPNPFWDWVAEMDGAFQEGAPNDAQGDNGEGPSNEDARHEHMSSSSHEKVSPDYNDDKTPLGDEYDDPPSPLLAASQPQPDTEYQAEPPHGPPPQGPPPHRGGWRGRGRHHHRGGPHGHHGPGGPHGHHGPDGSSFNPWQAGGMPFFPGAFGGRRGGWRGRGGRGGAAGWGRFFDVNKGGLNMETLGEFMRDNFGFDAVVPKSTEEKDFKPPVDVFDTSDAYVIHVSLAGAQKEHCGVSWDRENSEVSVSGVIHRPGDEALLKTLALDERNIGVFERKIKLGSKSQPAAVNADGITAKMEDGVLMIRVPKADEFVEIKKVDIQ